jgi:CubicO group peptidase (beta-lactamase class C family)
MRKWLFAALASALALSGCDIVKLLTNLPKDRNVLFWTQEQRDATFRLVEKVGKTNSIEASGRTLDLPVGKPIKLDFDIDAYMKHQRSAGLIIIQDGKIRFEKYGLDYSKEGRWTSFSVAKSFTSTLVGAAIHDGAIKSLDDKVTDYIPDLKGSAYDAVSVRQLLTMTSGIKWNEDYTDPKSDVALMDKATPDPGVDVTVSYMCKLPREAPAGKKWVYKTGETNLIGVLVSSATHMKLADYLSDTIWKPFGMEQDGVWLLGSTGHEISGCCISASLRDYARFGLFVLSGGKGVVPDDWFAHATTKQADIGELGRGYGYQWWTNDDGSFAAQGIFGQGIFIDPKRKLVITSNGDWPTATDPGGVGKEREAFYKGVQYAVDGGR